MPIEPTILAAAGSGLIAAIEQAGIAPRALLKEAGLGPDSLSDPSARVSLRGFVRLLELAAARTGDPCFGLHHGMTYHPSEAGVLGYAMLSAPTVGTALHNLVRFVRIQVDRAQIELDGGQAHALLGFRLLDSKITMRRQYNERIVAMIFNAIRIATGSRWFPDQVWFEHPAPQDDSEHRRLFRSPVRFGQASNQLIFERSLLDRPLKTADPQLFQALVPHNRDPLAGLLR